MGVVTGIVQEFQFGMNWSNYSVFVGNILGAPLAMEGLVAFFAESTFIGLWAFGRGRLFPLVHTLTICVVSLGTVVSAFFILTANAWMQHPVGYRIVGHQAKLLGSLRLSLGPPGSQRIPRPARTAAAMTTADNYPIGGCAATARPANLSVDCRSTGFPHKEPSDDNHN